MRRLASFAAGSARNGSTPFSQRFEPAVRSACRSELREDPDRLEVRRLQQQLARVVGDLGLLAAHDRRQRDGALGVRDHEVGEVEPALDAVERPQRSPSERARRTTIRPPASFARSNACSGLPQTCIT